MNKKKVLILTNKLNIGGYDIVAFNLQKNLNLDKFECFYLVRGDEKGLLEQRVIENGAQVFHQPSNTLNYFKSYFYLKHFFKENNFDIVHSHLTFFSGIVMRAAFKAGVKKRIAHSHFTDSCIENRSKLKTIIASLYQAFMRRWLKKYATDLIACGPEAGEFLYGKVFRHKGILLNNGINKDEFLYSEMLRYKMRKKLGITDEIIIGHVGRLNYIKNHKFIIDIFYEFQKLHPKSKLLIVGDGEQRLAIETKAKKLGIFDKVFITGIRNDVNKLLLAMDCFVFPSLKEGFPLTLVEAQATKLPCVISDSVTKYAKINSNVIYMSLSEKPENWADKIYQLIKIDRKTIDNSKLINEFDIEICAKKLESIYLN